MRIFIKVFLEKLCFLLQLFICIYAFISKYIKTTKKTEIKIRQNLITFTFLKQKKKTINVLYLQLVFTTAAIKISASICKRSRKIIKEELTYVKEKEKSTKPLRLLKKEQFVIVTYV